MWKHNSQGSYQQYYGVQYPFDIGIVINNKFTSSELQALQIFCEWIKLITLENIFIQISSLTKFCLQ